MNSLETIRHSLSHVLASAVAELYPDVKFAIGPAIDTGFYYDFDFGDQKIGDAELKEIEKKMEHLAKQNLPITNDKLQIDEAIKKAEKENQPYKKELIEDLKKQGEKEVSYYTVGKFTDLCKGPHIENTNQIPKGSWKLNKLAGAYWRGDEKNKMLTRIYGLAFASKEELDNYLKILAEAEKRDHRKLGKEMGLFIFSDLVGPGLPIYTEKGAIVRREIINYSNALQKTIGYREVHTPNITKAELFKVSGHYEKYQADMFRVVSHYTEEEYYLKPMNCPHHTQIYASTMRSYKDLPIRIADFANLYRDEKPGELSGLTRLRCFCQDDGHCFCREDQIKQEFIAVLGIIKKAMETYGMKYNVRLSLWDETKKEKFLGDPSTWEKSQKILEEILIESKIDYYKAVGEAAIYGPKMDLISKDSLGREWQISTIQLDFIMPRRFGLTFIDSDGKEKTPVMIHRAIVGSPERFMGILIEHYAGNFPVWLSPVQVKILSVGEHHLDYCRELLAKFQAQEVRAELDDSDETVGNKTRKAVNEKIPYILVVGDKEMASNTLAIRERGQKDLKNMNFDELVETIKQARPKI
ncbi:MAG: threonine--tRNA ligase [Patescibacteria group bacterium]|nr:threonine--tRNA ligase [Patescibacteria group bacterium]